MMNAFILSTAIAWGHLNAGQALYSDPEKEALKALGKAMYIELELNKVANRAEKRYVPRYIKEYGIWPTMIIKISTEKKISYKWTF